MNTMSKASVLARLRHLHSMSNAAVDTMDKTRKTSKHALGHASSVQDVNDSLKRLIDDIEKQITEECTPAFHYDPKTIAATMDHVAKKMRERFKDFPIAAALIETMLLFFDAELRYFASFLALRAAAGAEERQNPVHKSFYHVNGESNDIGNRVGKPPE